MRAPVFTLASLLLACGTSAKGETCSKTGDCKGDLLCKESTCIDPIEMAAEMASTIAGAAMQYRINKRGDCPRSLYQLEAEGFIGTLSREDPWGNQWVFRCEIDDGPVSVISVGPDHKPGTEDDVSNLGADALAE